MTEQLPEFDPDVDVDVDQAPGVDGAGEDVHTGPEPTASPAPSAPPAFSYNQRLYAFGFTGSGKSEILNLIFSGVRCQRLMIDNKPEFAIADVEPVHTPEAIDWTAPIIHYQPAPGSDSSQYEDIFAAAFTRRGLLILVHEWGAIVDYNANRAGRYLISYVAQGERLGLGLLAGSTRPRLIPVAGITEASHFIVFGPSFAKREDLDAAAEALSPVDGRPLTAGELGVELARLQLEHGEHASLWKERRSGRLLAVPPLPEQLRNYSIVHRVEDA